MRHPSQVALGLVIVSAGLSACWTSASEGAALRTRVHELEEGQTTQRDELRDESATLRGRLADIRNVSPSPATWAGMEIGG